MQIAPSILSVLNKDLTSILNKVESSRPYAETRQTRLPYQRQRDVRRIMRRYGRQV